MQPVAQLFDSHASRIDPYDCSRRIRSAWRRHEMRTRVAGFGGVTLDRMPVWICVPSPAVM